jgi:hypothetical protein
MHPGASAIRIIMIILIALIIYVVVAFGGLIAYWLLRPNTAQVDPMITSGDPQVIARARHNSNVDMTFWNGEYYLVHQHSRYHFAHKSSELRIYRSKDTEVWREAGRIATGEDIRDPKFADINGRLFMYALKNVIWSAKPHQTVYTSTEDGNTWASFKKMEPDGWLFWRPKTFDQKIWYCPAYWKEMGRSALFRSEDGINWKFVSDIYVGDNVNETAIEFSEDGGLIALVRLQGMKGDFGDNIAGTACAESRAPFTEWQLTKNSVTRLDGPLMFRWKGRLYAAGRYQPERDGWLFQQGSILSRKRTSLFAVDVEKGRLVWLSDLPSNGDTAYPGILLTDGRASIGYYTSPAGRDVPWIYGMFTSSWVQIAEMDLAGLERLAELKTNQPDPDPASPAVNYIVFFLLTSISIFGIIWMIRRRTRKGIKR